MQCSLYYLIKVFNFPNVNEMKMCILKNILSFFLALIMPAEPKHCIGNDQICTDVAAGFHFWQIHQSQLSGLCRRLWSTAGSASVNHLYILSSGSLLSPLSWREKSPANTKNQFQLDINRLSSFCSQGGLGEGGHLTLGKRWSVRTSI